MSLIDQVKQGEQRAWNELVAKYQRAVMATALAVIRDLDEADDITQEVFVRLYTKINTINEPLALRKWLMRTTYNLACDRRRFLTIRGWFSKREDPEELAQTSSTEALEKRQVLKIVRDWMKAKLTKRESLILQLKTGEEMTFQEIAEVLKISQSSVKTQYYRAIEKMKKLGAGYEA